MHKFETENFVLHYNSSGQGAKTLLFLHGFLEDHSMWNSVYPEFVNAGFRCITVDLPCHGLSRFEGRSCPMIGMAAGVQHLLEDLDIPVATIIGHSMGGYVGLEMLRMARHDLVLLHSNFWADNERKKADRNRVIEIVKKNKNLFLQEAIPGLFSPENRVSCVRDIGVLIEKAMRIPASEIAAATAGMRDRRSSYDVFETHKIRMIQGQADPVVPRDILELECKKLPSPVVVNWIENCGHMSIWEQPAELIRVLNQIL
jgi:pimeloyl-ACP methyl ester carboxylesterase